MEASLLKSVQHLERKLQLPRKALTFVGLFGIAIFSIALVIFLLAFKVIPSGLQVEIWPKMAISLATNSHLEIESFKPLSAST